MSVFREAEIRYLAGGRQLGRIATVGADGTPSHRRLIGTFEGTEHEIDLEPGSLAERGLGEPVHEARCHHHQAIDRLGEGLTVSGRARDGVAEAIELADGGAFALGVQWHPEAGDRLDLFRAFCRAAGEWREALAAVQPGPAPPRAPA